MKLKVMLCLALALLLLSACGGTTDEVQPAPAPETQTVAPAPSEPDSQEAEPAPAAQETPAAVNLAEAREAMIEALALADPEDVILVETPKLLALYGIEESWVAQSASFVTMSGIFPDEVILTEAVDAEAARQIAEKLQVKLEEVMVQAQSYDPETYQLAQECAVEENGLFVSLLLSPKKAELGAVYAQYIG